MNSYTMDLKYGRCMHQQEQPGSSNIAILLGVFNKTIILLATLLFYSGAIHCVLVE